MRFWPERPTRTSSCPGTRAAAGSVNGLASVVLFSRRPDEVVAFYRAVGVPLEDEDHGDGVMHHAADVDGIHMAVLPADEDGNDGSGDAWGDATSPAWRAAGTTFVGLWVDSLEESTAALERAGAPLLRSHEQCDWGCRVVVRDPDGRAVEVNQAGHCA
jgi:catechol 2,3-dioxygenase-like lactoylglutathione lyase family enzyme